MIWGIVIGGILLEMKNPAKRLPISKRLIELIRNGLFSLMLMRVGNRGSPELSESILSAI